MESEFMMREGEKLSVEFSLRLRARLKTVLEHRALALGEIVRECNGAYPVDVHEELSWLVGNQEVVVGADSRYELASNRFPRVACGRWTQEAHSARSYVLPEPHPVDFDWRFTPEAISTLLEQIEGLVSRDDEVAILGAPTLFMALASRGLNVRLFDRNTHLLNGLRKAGYVNLVNHDLFCRMPLSKRFAIAVADPPWYPECYQAFVHSARALLRCEGRLLLSVLPALTRPAAEVDRAALTNLTAHCGFTEITRMENVLLYECPPFEMAALQSRGLDCGPWRSGDLVVYQLKKEHNDIDCLPRLTGDKTFWCTFTLNRLVVKVRSSQPKAGAVFDFRPVSEDGKATLGTVSRRDPLRSLIDLWTSRNSAFKVSRSEILFQLLHLMENNNSDPLNAVRQLYQLDEAEATRISNLIDWLTTESLS